MLAGSCCRHVSDAPASPFDELRDTVFTELRQYHTQECVSVVVVVDHVCVVSMLNVLKCRCEKLLIVLYSGPERLQYRC